ncbi:hypothetical protein [Aureivirga sp. CE67]|uniref:hypothetical protein n=1 Tax=Aureivirga sp. CE67 TaxID=1788983 RepID=UPI0018CA3C43|nr:hypothetical protein [Aureivirga sp. CE67]
MERVRKIINSNIDKYEDFSYYELHLDKINKNLNDHPDISIETCKSLIEGISKSILNRLDNTFDEKKETKGRSAKSVQQLFKKALENIEKHNEKFESQYVHSSGQIINLTSQIRTERGDISHGKSVPKERITTTDFATLVKEMTDINLEYVLKFFFEIDLSYKHKFDYNSEELKEYNFWLDENETISIKGVLYSKLLYENDYDLYENRYNDEFLLEKENELNDNSINEKEQFKEESEKEDLEINKIEVKEEAKKESSKEILKEEKDLVENEIKDEKIEFANDEEVKKLKVLTNTFNEEEFWTEKRDDKVKEFANNLELNFEAMKNIFSNFFYSDKEPSNDELSDAMSSRPKLKDRKNVLGKIREAFSECANALNSDELE